MVEVFVADVDAYTVMQLLLVVAMSNDIVLAFGLLCISRANIMVILHK